MTVRAHVRAALIIALRFCVIPARFIHGTRICSISHYDTVRLNADPRPNQKFDDNGNGQRIEALTLSITCPKLKINHHHVGRPSSALID